MSKTNLMAVSTNSIDKPLLMDSSIINSYQILLIILLFFCTSKMRAQEYDQWAFGWDAIVDVIPTTSVILPTGTNTMDALGGTASYCDANGNLIFYTDGRDIFNHQLGTSCMGCLNGLNNLPPPWLNQPPFGSQTVLILPKPNTSPTLKKKEFYIFTVSNIGADNKGLSYYVYNALNNTVTGPTRMGFTAGTEGSFCYSTVAAVKNCDNDGYWVVVKAVIVPTGAISVINSTPPNNGNGTNSSMYAYAVNSTGVANTPVISDAGFGGQYSIMTGTSAAKFSPNKELFAIANKYGTNNGSSSQIFAPEVHLSRFDCSTGKFNWLQSLPFNSSVLSAIGGLSFSPNSQVLYASGSTASWSTILRQYDLSNLHCDPSAPQPFCDITSIPSTAIGSPNQLQLTSNNEIIHSRSGSNDVDVITSPNNIGCSAIGYVTNGLHVSNIGISRFGLPNNIDGLTNPSPAIEICNLNCNEYSFWLSGCAPEVTWNFGDGSPLVTGTFTDPIINNTTTSGFHYLPSHIFPATGGTFLITASLPNSSGIGVTVVSTQITVAPLTPPVFSATSFPFCANSGTSAINVLNSTLYTAINWEDCSAPGNNYTFPNFTGSTYNINWAGVPAGNYTLCATGVSNSCTTAVSTYNFTFGGNTNWHQTTKNAFGDDVITDVVTDSDENVYVTGFFENYTTLNGGSNSDITMTAGLQGERASFIAKYSQCGDLIWEAHSYGSKDNTSNSIAVDNNNGLVYIVGDLEGMLQWNSSTLSTCSGLTVNAGNWPGGQTNRGYLASFEMLNGCIQDLELVSVNNFVRCNAIDVNENTGDVFVGGSASSSTIGTDPAAFVCKYSFLSYATPLVTELALSNSVTNSKVNDIVYDDQNNILWAIGDFRNGISFSATNLSTNNWNMQDAFLLSYQDNGASFTLSSFRKGSSDIFMSGEGITLDNTTGHIFFTGTYSTNIGIPSAFSYIVNPLAASGTNASYMMKLDVSHGVAWVRSGIVNGSARGRSVAFKNNTAYFTGHYTNSTINFQSLGSFPHVNSSLLNHLYVVAYNNSGVGLWGNYTVDPNFLSEHKANSITVNDLGEAFVVGSYLNSMDYQLGLAPILTSTPAAGGTNGMVLRVQSNGAFQRVKAPSKGLIDLSVKEGFTVYPNPSSGIIRFQIENPDSPTIQIKVMGIAGKVILDKELLLNSDNELVIDLSNYSNGVYIISTTMNSKIFYQKIMKQ